VENVKILELNYEKFLIADSENTDERFYQGSKILNNKYIP